MQYYDGELLCDDEFTSAREAERYEVEETRECCLCGRELTDDEDGRVCQNCIDEFTTNYELILKYINQNDETKAEFYVNYMFGVEGDFYPELLLLCKKEVDRDIDLGKHYILKHLEQYAKDGIEEYIEFLEG